QRGKSLERTNELLRLRQMQRDDYPERRHRSDPPGARYLLRPRDLGALKIIRKNTSMILTLEQRLADLMDEYYLSDILCTIGQLHKAEEKEKEAAEDEHARAAPEEWTAGHWDAARAQPDFPTDATLHITGPNPWRNGSEGARLFDLMIQRKPRTIGEAI